MQQQVDDDDEATTDDLITQADAICEYLKNNWPQNAEPHLVSATVQALTQPEWLKVSKLFSSTVRLVFWQYR